MAIGPDREKFLGKEYNISLANAFETSTANAAPRKPEKEGLTEM